MWPIENQARSLKTVRKLRGSNTQSSKPNFGNFFSVDIREKKFA
jgi:hypothetical protein